MVGSEGNITLFLVRGMFVKVRGGMSVIGLKPYKGVKGKPSMSDLNMASKLSELRRCCRAVV